MSDEVLREGSHGESVTALQQRLVDLGYDLRVDGDFGPRTEAAVKAYQSATGLDDDGVVGPRTWMMLDIGGVVDDVVDYVHDVFAGGDDGERDARTDEPEAEVDLGTAAGVDVGSLPVLRRGAEGDHVEFLHRCLPYAGYSPDPAEVRSGAFGVETEAAVEEFQGQTGLRVDGVVGPRTWRKLLPYAGVLPSEVESLDDASGRRPELKDGSSGGWVSYLQEVLLRLYPGSLQVTGTYDDATERLVRHVQEEAKLVVDGVVAEDTWKWLELLLEARNQPAEAPAPGEPETPLPTPTPEQVSQGGELVWPLIAAAHEDAKWFASRDEDLARYDGSHEGAKLLLGVSREGGKAIVQGVERYAEKFNPLGLITRGLMGFGKETEFLVAWPRISAVIGTYERAFTSALMATLSGQVAAYVPEDYILQAVQAEVYDRVSRFSPEQRHWIRTWIAQHNGINDVMLMRELD
jgi:peptidoglycan hydrolase-like protein with peptidoglycan-binding domain